MVTRLFFDGLPGCATNLLIDIIIEFKLKSYILQLSLHITDTGRSYDMYIV